MIEEYHLEEGKRTAFSEGVEKGVKKGLEEGMKKEKIQTAKSLLLVGMDIAMICQVTRLTEAEVLALQNEA